MGGILLGKLPEPIELVGVSAFPALTGGGGAPLRNQSYKERGISFKCALKTAACQAL